MIQIIKSNYYLNSLFWSSTSKILNAIFGFLTVPLLLGLYGKANYGILALATSCNGYMNLLDLGMNVGAVKYYSQWKVEGRTDLISRVAGTNITFYLIIAIINAVLLLLLAVWGESFFNITHEQFLILQKCLIVIAVFSIFSWGATPFNQLLIADKRMGYTMKVQSFLPLLKFILIGITLWLKLSLTNYFLFITLIMSLLIIPYSIKCKDEKLINTVRPMYYWKDFKVVFLFSMSIFALSFFQTTATQSRPIILSFFAVDGADAVANFRILEVLPSLIIMLSGTFSSVFLPRTSEMVALKDQDAIETFAYKWTMLTSVIVNILCFPLILGSKEFICAYVGDEYRFLYFWLIFWVITVLLQMHTTAGNALVLAYGKTKKLVIITAITCSLSLLINILLCKYFQVGSAIIAYFVYVFIMIASYYVFFYKNLLKLSRRKMFMSFLKPTVVALFAYIICLIIPFDNISFGFNARIQYLIILLCKSIIWFLIYSLFLHLFKVINYKESFRNK